MRLDSKWTCCPAAFILAAVIVFSLFPAAAGAAGGPGTSRWTVEDILLAENASSWAVSPDGTRAVFVKARMDKDKNGRVSNIFLVDLGTKKETQLTRGSDGASQPMWSPDGSVISFVSSRPLPKPNPDVSGPQIWLMSVAGGEPYPLTGLARGVQDYRWIDDATIYFSAQEDPALYEQELKRKKDDAIVVDDVRHEPPVRIFKIGIRDGRTVRLTDNRDFIRVWAPSPDGRYIATSHQTYLSFEWDHRVLPLNYLYDAASGGRTELFKGLRVVPSSFVWSRDGSGFYMTTPYSSDPRFFTASINVLYYFDAATAGTVQVGLDWPNGLEGRVEAVDGGFLAFLADGVGLKPALYVKDGLRWKRSDIIGEHTGHIFGVALGRDGRRLVYRYSTASVPDQWYAAYLEREGGKVSIKDPVLVTDLNPSFKDKARARTEVVRWKGALGELVEGLLYYPIGYEEGKRYPLFTAPHGGPAGADMDAWDESWAYPHQLICQRGAFILKPNYHGSTNYGLKFVESISRAKYYEYPIEDIEKGVDHLIARGLVDPDRIGTFGWSNGSILSIGLCVANPDRYKVAGTGAGDVEFISDWSNVDFGQSFDAYYFGKSPLEDPMLYIRLSPFFKLGRVKTPTIIFFGTEDRNVPTSQGWSHYRALYHLDKAPVKFILFPGEPHSLGRLSHQLRKVEEELAWFDRYVFKTLEAANEAVKDDSPLGRTLRLMKAARVGELYGTAVKDGTLVPETVRRGTFEVGRFEVTRAQYAAFDASFEYPAGTGNLPACGMGGEKAAAYAAWLSKLTGAEWSLPSEAEAAGLYGKVSGGNTLDWWAGYPLNPDDARLLIDKISGLGGRAPLLKEVGTFPGDGGDGEEAVYDLSGNAAEWAIGKDGKPAAMGGSADTPADARARVSLPAPEYTGFRVVKRGA